MFSRVLGEHQCLSLLLGFPGDSDGRASQPYRRPGFDPWVEKIRGRKKWPPTPVFLAWEIPWTEEPGRLQSMGSKESDTTEQLIFSHPTSTWNVATLKVTFPSSLFTNTHSNLQPRFLRLTSYSVQMGTRLCRFYVLRVSWICSLFTPTARDLNQTCLIFYLITA